MAESMERAQAHDLNLNDTTALMTSDDYRDRFKAEYAQLCIRIEKLNHIIQHYDDGALDFQPKTPLFLLTEQWESMMRYAQILVARAQIEEIEL